MWNGLHQRSSFRKLSRDSIKNIESPSVQQCSEIDKFKRQKKLRRKLDRSFRNLASHSAEQHDSCNKLKIQEKESRTKILSLLKDKLPHQLPNINRNTPTSASLHKKIAIISPIPRNDIMECRAKRFENTVASKRNVGSSSSVTSSQSKPTHIDKNYSSTSNVSSHSSKTLTPKRKEIVIKLNSRKMDDNAMHRNRLKLSSSAPKPSSTPALRRQTVEIRSSPVLLTALERKRKQQQRLQICRDEKNPKCTGGNAVKRQASGMVHDSKCSIITHSSQMVDTLTSKPSTIRQPSTSKLLPIRQPSCLSSATNKTVAKPVSADGAFSHRNQKTDSLTQSAHTSSKSDRDGKILLSRKTDGSKVIKLSSPSTQTDTKIRTHYLKPSPDRSSADVRSRYSPLNKHDDDDDEVCIISHNKSLNSESKIRTTRSFRFQPRFQPYASSDKSINESSKLKKIAYLPPKSNNRSSSSANKLPKKIPDSRKLETTLVQRNSTTPNNLLNSSDLKNKSLEPRNVNCKTSLSNSTIPFVDLTLPSTSSSGTSTNAPLITEQEKCSSDVEMEDVSISLPSLTSLTCSMEMHDLPLPDSKHYSFVVDTNVFMHHLNFIDQLKDTPVEGCGPPYIYVPYIVITELDKLKAKDSPHRALAAKAIRYLYSMLESKHPRIQGQSVKLSYEITRVFGKQNDDGILAFCDVLVSKTSREKTGLITNDVNLCNKALVNKINAYTTDNLFTRVKADVRIIHSNKNDISRSAVPEKDTTMVLDNPLETPEMDLEVDNIVCEAKLILREVLEPFLKESMKTAFGDLSESILNPPPTCLVDILGYYNKYWLSVFGIMFKKNVRTLFDSVRNTFFNKKGYFCNVDDAFRVIIAIENICKAIASKKPSVQAQVREVSQLMDACNELFERRKQEEPPPVVKLKNQNEISLGVFNHLWELINYLSGMIMDFVGLPHQYKYIKPAEMPSKSEFSLLISNFFPALHKIKQGMSKLMDITTIQEQAEHEADYMRLCNYLLQFVPSLQIPVEPPPADGFDVQCLKHFMINQENRETIKNGFRQLVDYQTNLVQVIHLPVWKT